MEAPPYINSPAERTNMPQRREMCRSERVKVLHIVGIIVGLLCIILSVVGIYLRLQREPTVPACPPGWSRVSSSCYQPSSTMSTWEYAREACESKGAHLLILNDRLEEKIVHAFGDQGTLWIGLKGRSAPTTSGKWTWVDNSPLTYGNWQNLQPNLQNWPEGCVYVTRCSSSPWKTWGVNKCDTYYYWICEKEL